MNETVEPNRWNELMRLVLALPEQASTFASEMDALHYFEFIVMNLIALALGVLGVVFLIRYRRRREDQVTPRVVFPVWLEATYVLGLLAFFLLWFDLGFRQYVAISVPPPGATEVYVTGKQWMWKFAYAEGPSSVGVLYVPRGRPVKLVITSRDVIHSFYVPAFRIKQDAVPGRYTTIWFEARLPGRYQAFCTEFCGTAHSNMLAEVVVLEPEAFEAWLAGPRLVGAGMAERGRAAAAQHGCLRCHTIDGTQDLGPSWLGLYGRWEELTDGRRVLVDEAYITRSMMDPNVQVVAGYPPVMPSYHGQISPADTAAIIEYIKALRTVPPRSAAGPGG